MDEKQQKEYKMNNLIGVTISALLGESRNTNNIIQHNNLMCVDVDEDDNKELFTKYNIEEIPNSQLRLKFGYTSEYIFTLKMCKLPDTNINVFCIIEMYKNKRILLRFNKK